MPAHQNIGKVETPLQWAKWLVEESGAYAAWRSGKAVLDPACGTGVFFEALIAMAIERGERVDRDCLARLIGVEISATDKHLFLERMSSASELEFPPENFVVGDMLELQMDRQFDLIVGNPPWSNHCNLPADMKKRWQKLYIRHGLVQSKKDVLLGSSRVDICALVIKKCLDEHLKSSGMGAFFTPLSLLFNDGANDGMRPYPGSHHNYAISKIWDLGGERVFQGVSTRYGAIKFEKGRGQTWPVQTLVRVNGRWNGFHSTSSDGRSGGWVRHEANAAPLAAPRIQAKRTNRPRQGINTCGANRVYMFDCHEDKYLNYDGRQISIERDLLYPVMHKNIFSPNRASRIPRDRWILIPHDSQTGRPLTWDELAAFPHTREYLAENATSLKSRKGVMIGSSIRKGLWWSLFGVGPYAFAPWKVAWESLGQREFRPVVLRGVWQGNQAMHAYCPCYSEDEASALCQQLREPSLERWLKSFSMEGTCNWAQPGRVSKAMCFESEVESGTSETACDSGPSN